MRLIRLVALLLLSASPAWAQWTASPNLHASAPLGTMDDYFGRGTGFGLALRSGPGPVRWKIQASWTRFGATTVTRNYQGGATPIGITSGATTMLLTAGPEVATSLGRTRLALGAGAGVAHVQATGSTLFAGDPNQVNRSNSYATATWAAQVHAMAGRRLSRNVDVMVEGSLTQVGRAQFLREYNLPIGQISGMYLNPSPYAPRLATLSLSLRIAL